MADQKLKFQEFYELLLEAKAGEYERPLKIYEQLLYENYRYWSMLALNRWIVDTEIEENMDKRQDKSIISQITERNGCTAASWMEGVCKENVKHYNMLEDLAKQYDIDMQVMIESSDKLIERVIEELIDEYDINIVGAYEGW